MFDPSFIDDTPTFYLLMLGYLLIQIGKRFAQRFPQTTNFQSGTAVLLFAYLTIPRLFYQQPVSATEGAEIAVRAAAFAAVGYGLIGFVAMGHAGLKLLFHRGKLLWQQWRLNRKLREQRRVAEEEQRRRDAYIPSEAEIQEAARLQFEEQKRRNEEGRRRRAAFQRREEEARRREADRQKRHELRLQAELEMEFATDDSRRQKLNEFISVYAAESLPVDVYEQRLEMIRNAVARNSPVKAKNYQSMHEIIEDFDKQITDIDNSTNSEFEKQSLRALIHMETPKRYSKVYSTMSRYLIGRTPGSRENVYLPVKSLPTHTHLIGATGVGKSTLIMRILAQLMIGIVCPTTIFVIDPLGGLADAILNFVAHPYLCPDSVRKRLVYIEPANTKYCMPFNPLVSEDENDLYYRTGRTSDVMLRSGKSHDMTLMLRLRRWLYNCFYSVGALGYPPATAQFLIQPGTNQHEELLRQIPDRLRNEWAEILKAGMRERIQALDSTRNRLNPFFTCPVLNNMLSSRESFF